MSAAFAPKPALQLGLFALICAALLASLHFVTEDTIERNASRHAAELLAHVSLASDQPAVKTTVPIGEKDYLLWQIQADEEVSAIVLAITAGGGYSGDIDLLVGIDNQLRITGVRVTRHRETPGLGDKIDPRRSNWIESFNGHSLQKPKQALWAVKKDGGSFDQFTGATITPRAVVRAVRDSLIFSTEHRASLFSQSIKSQQP